MIQQNIGINSKQSVKCKNEKSSEQAGAELCQAPVKLGLAKIFHLKEN
jgi:hypothetical protein